jgi:hypothetical protein
MKLVDCGPSSQSVAEENHKKIGMQHLLGQGARNSRKLSLLKE